MTWLATLDEVPLSTAERARLLPYLSSLEKVDGDLQVWSALTELTADEPLSFSGYRLLWEAVFAAWDVDKQGPRPMWRPTANSLEAAHLTRWIRDLGCGDYGQLHRWSVEHRGEFWGRVIDELDVKFKSLPQSILDETGGPTEVKWLPGARLNIVESCFLADEDSPAIVFAGPGGAIETQAYGELRQQVHRVAAALRATGFEAGDAIAVVLPMTAESVAIYLGIIAAGCVVVSIADSFAAPQIASRLNIAQAKGLFTYEAMGRGGKRLDLYSRIVEAAAPTTIVLPTSRGSALTVELRAGDISWKDFLDAADANGNAEREGAFVAASDEAINILFSSGTTGDPKAIPWSHTTPIKCAADGLFHHDIHAADVVAWPTNLGWMMGPWLIFASLMNRATIALYEDAPAGAGFGRFVQDAGVTMLGVVPTIVSAWRSSSCMEEFDWSAIRTYSSTGEASNADDMFYLSWLAGFRPVIEYCGGTEIGGGYITSTVVEPNAPSTFNTPAMGLDFVILDEQGVAADEGELFLVPPSIGLSTTLLNRDHAATYYEGVPSDADGRRLRRHGDHIRRLSCGTFVAGGRVDDTMNLGGIKISSAEIEKVLNQTPGVRETAAVAVPGEDGGPENLFVFAVPEEPGATSKVDALQEDLLLAMNEAVKQQLNPLFKIRQVVVKESLPRTASNKVMRRKLRDELTSSGR